MTTVFNPYHVNNALGALKDGTYDATIVHVGLDPSYGSKGQHALKVKFLFQEINATHTQNYVVNTHPQSAFTTVTKILLVTDDMNRELDYGSAVGQKVEVEVKTDGKYRNVIVKKLLPKHITEARPKKIGDPDPKPEDEVAVAEQLHEDIGRDQIKKANSIASGKELLKNKKVGKSLTLIKKVSIDDGQ